MSNEQLIPLLAEATAINARLMAALHELSKQEDPPLPEFLKSAEVEPIIPEDPPAPKTTNSDIPKRTTHKVRKLTAAEKRTARFALNRAVMIAGTANELTRALGIAHQNVGNWKRNGRVAPRAAQEIENLTGVPKEQLCPDYFGAKTDGQA